jgi:hypothetical protein
MDERNKDPRRILPTIGRVRPHEILARIQDPRLRWGDVPGGELIRRQLTINPDDPYLLELASIHLQSQVEKALEANDPFYGNYPPPGRLVPSGAFVIVGTLPTRDPMFKPADSFNHNVLVPGRAGSSKTTLVQLIAIQLARLGSCVVVVDQKRSWRKLLRRPELRGQGRVFQFQKHLRLNLFQTVSGEEQGAAAARGTRLIAENYGRYSAHRLLLDLLNEALSRGQPGSGVSLQDAINLVASFRPGRGYREAEYRESMLTVLKDMKNHFGGIFDWTSTDFTRVMFSQPGLNIIEAHGLPTQPLAILTDHLHLSCFSHRLYNKSARNIPVVFIREDAAAMADVQRDRETPGGVSLLSEMMILSRELNIGTIVISQVLGTLSPKIIQNAETVLACAMQGEDERVIQRLLGTTAEQTAMIRVLQPGQAVASIPSVWPLPVLIAFPPIPDADVTDEECNRTAEQFLTGVTAVKQSTNTEISVGKDDRSRGRHEETPAGAGAEDSGLDSDEIRVLILAGVPIPPPVTALYDQAGLGRSRGVSVAKALETKGLVRMHKYPTGNRGGQLHLIEITERGWQALLRHGIHQPKKVTKGSWEHNLAAAAVGELHRRQNDTVDYEVDLGGVRLDVRARRQTGQISFYQICLSSPSRETEAVMKAVNVPVVAENQLVLVCRDREFQKQLTSLLEKKDPEKRWEKNITMRLVAEVLAEVYAGTRGDKS